MNNYEALDKLNDLRQRGVISDAEFETEKQKVLSGNFGNASQDGLIWGMPPNTYCMLMHLGPIFFLTLFGIAVPIVMWVINKDQFPVVDQHGKNILNWMISATIYSIVSGILIVVLIGAGLLMVLGLLVIVFGIMGAVKASKGEVWEYPLSIKFLK